MGTNVRNRMCNYCVVHDAAVSRSHLAVASSGVAGVGRGRDRAAAGTCAAQCAASTRGAAEAAPDRPKHSQHHAHNNRRDVTAATTRGGAGASAAGGWHRCGQNDGDGHQNQHSTRATAARVSADAEPEAASLNAVVGHAVQDTACMRNHRRIGGACGDKLECKGGGASAAHRHADTAADKSSASWGPNTWWARPRMRATCACGPLHPGK